MRQYASEVELDLEDTEGATYEVITYLYASDGEVAEAASEVGIEAYNLEATNWGARYALVGSLAKLREYFALYLPGNTLTENGPVTRLNLGEVAK